MRITSLLCVLLFSSFTFADGPTDNIPENVRRIPKLGIEVPAAERAKLEEQIAAFEKQISRLRLRTDSLTRELFPDVLIYHKAAHDALKYQEFFDAKEIPVAFTLLKEGMERAEQLEKGSPLWTTQTGLVVRGYVSKIDGSVQPYGLVIPKSYSEKGPRVRLDVWFHGRGETLSELNFIQGRRTSIGEYAPADTIVLHPYGRYCNANKFAGEIDTLEALEAVQKQYRIDEDRISVRGFSMGGAAAWQFAVHYTDRWFAANPGAGFSETPDFLKVFQKETLKPTWWEQKLWHMYDCTDYAANLYNLPTIAYSGELDTQKQAADIMAVALEKEGMTLTHIIGPATKHAIHKDSKVEIEKRMASVARVGRSAVPKVVVLKTYTLRYNRMHWVQIDGMGEHWEEATVKAELEPSGIRVRAKNVTDMTFDIPPGGSIFGPGEKPSIRFLDVDGISSLLQGPLPASDGSWRVRVHLDQAERKWKLGHRLVEELVLPLKRHGLQGPIDDAFMDSFIFVRPTGTAYSELVDKWSKSELDRAIEYWRRHFRGEAPVKDDKDITEADIAGANLVLWGDPSSNILLKKIAAKLPIQLEISSIVHTGYSTQNHALILIAPNPLNPKRYVVLNSSFTFRDYAYLNNARQVPMLPDWAIVDLRTPPNAVWPGKVVEAGFFDETWKVKAGKK